MYQYLSTKGRECRDCQISAESVRLLYWPIENSTISSQNGSLASASSSQYTTVSNGFTFTSPSVYVAYVNIGTTSDCPYATTITGSLYNATRGYDSASLSTDPCGYGYGNWKPVNYTDLQYPAAARTINTGCDVPPMGLMNGEVGVFHGFLPWGTGNPAATPLFSVPDDVTLMNPSWKSCSVMSVGVWDPPIKLSRKTAMVPAAPTLSQQLTATPRSPISTPYGPATVVPSVGDPKADAPQVLPPITPENPGSTSPTSDSSFDSSDPPDHARTGEDPSSDGPEPDASSVMIPSPQTHGSAQGIKGSTSNVMATPVANVQSPAPGLSPEPKLSVQPDVEDTRFALSLVAPAATSYSDTVGGQFLAAIPDFISPSAPPVISDQSGVDIADTSVELDALSQLAIGDSALALPVSTRPLVHTIADLPSSAEPSGFAVVDDGGSVLPGGASEIISGTVAALASVTLQIGSTAIPLSAAPSIIFTVGEQIFTAESNAIFMPEERIARAGWGTTIDGTHVSLGSSGLMDIGSSTISLLADQALPTVFTIGSEVFTPNPTAISMDGTTITAGGSGITIAGTSVDLQASGTLVIGNSTFAVIPTNLYTSATSTIFESQAIRRRRNRFFGGAFVITICIVLVAL